MQETKWGRAFHLQNSVTGSESEVDLYLAVANLGFYAMALSSIHLQARAR